MNPLWMNLLGGLAGMPKDPRVGLGTLATVMITIGAMLFDGNHMASWVMAGIIISSGSALALMLGYAVLFRNPQWTPEPKQHRPEPGTYPAPQETAPGTWGGSVEGPGVPDSIPLTLAQGRD